MLYEEYTYDDGSGARTWSRILASYTDDPAGGLFMNVFDEATFFDWETLLGTAYSGIIPVVGNAHVDYCDTLVGDLNNDCRVDLEDFAEMAKYWLN